MERKTAFAYTSAYLLLLVFLRLVTRFRGLELVGLLRELGVLAGGVLGAWVLDREEKLMFFLGHPSEKPVLRNVLGQATLVGLAFFIGTSSVSLFPLSFVLGLLTRSLTEQYLEGGGMKGLGVEKRLGKWFWMVGGELKEHFVKGYLTILAFFLLYFSWMLIGK